MPQNVGDTGVPDARRLQAELEFVRELCEVVASNNELHPILEWIVRKTIRMLSADEGSIKLVTDVPGQPPVTFYRPADPGSSYGSWPQAVSTNVMGYLLNRGDTLITPDLMGDPSFPNLSGGCGQVRAVLAVPLRVGNRITGMLAVTEAQPGRKWTANDVQLLAIVAGNSAGAIERARLRVEEDEKKRLEEEKKRLEEENRRMDRELEKAQMRLVPTGPLVLGPWHVEGRVVRARPVGGNAFDYRMLGEGRLGIAIADVYGKGPDAALRMANMLGVLRVSCNGNRPIRDAIRLVNENVALSCAGGRFITLFYGEIDPAAGRLSYVNAGHKPPLLRRRDGRVEELLDGGLPLGVEETADYEQGTTEFQKGDSLLMYCHGLTGAPDPRAEFGEERLRTLWTQHGARPPREVIDLLFERISTFRGAAEQYDDMTAVVVGARAG